MYNKYLDTFIEVADTGSFTKAADKFLLSPTAVMKQINMLESDLDLKLLNKTHQGATLTESGKIIYSAAKRIIEYSNKEIEKAQALEGKENHTETLTTLKNKNTTFDCIVSPCDSRNWLKDVNFLELGKTRYCITVPINHQLANKKEISINDLDNETIMISDRGNSPAVNNFKNIILDKCPNVKIEAVSFFYDIDVFNKCADEGNILISLDYWNIFILYLLVFH